MRMKLNKMWIFLLAILLIGALAMGCGETAPEPREPQETEEEEETEEAEEAEEAEETEEVAEGQEVYTGEAEGGHGPVVVEVTMEDNKIVGIEVVEENETEGLGDKAFEDLIPKIIDAQTTEGIDVWTGATLSSEALFEAVNEALSKAN